jgi:segregation and condensation protein B
MSFTPKPIPDMDEAPEGIRHAVKQLNLAYRRSAQAMTDDGAAYQARTATAPDEAEDPALAEAVRRAEAVLFAAGAPLSASQLAEALPPGVDVASVLMRLKGVYAARGVTLVEVDGRWRFQTAPDLAFLFVEERHQQKKLSQAALETLSIIAYGQPVTRAEIEAVRGVAVSRSIIDTLMETGWIRYKGRRKTPGRPLTLGTTPAFLEHFGLESLDVLPGRAELEAEGLLSDVIPDGLFADGSAMHHQDDPDALDPDPDPADFITDFMDAPEAD